LLICLHGGFSSAADWEEHPLRKKKVRYAALDAVIGYKLAHALVSAHWYAEATPLNPCT
jgi:ribonuclease D